MRRHLYTLLSGLITALSPLGIAAQTPEPAPPAFTERVVVPHWQWGPDHAQGRLNALFILNEEALYDAQALGLREDIEATALPVGGTNRVRTFDQDRFAKELEKPWNVIIIASEQGWQVLNEDNRQRLLERVHQGARLVITAAPKGFAPGLDETLATMQELDQEAVQGAALGALPSEGLRFRLPFRVSAYQHGSGQVTLFSGPNPFWLWSNAFVRHVDYGHRDTPEVTRAMMELHYAVAARIIRWSAGKLATATYRNRGGNVATAQPGEVVTLIVEPIEGGLNGEVLQWSAHTPFGEEISGGSVPFEQGGATIRFPVNYGGELLIRWRATKDGKTLDYGASLLRAPSGVALKLNNDASPDSREAAASVQWHTEGETAPGDTVHLEVYDPDGRLMAQQSAPVASASATLPKWEARYVTHELRALLLRGETILDEQRAPFNVAYDRMRDTKEFQVLVWGMEQGTLVEAGRYDRMREVGINGYAPIGLQRRPAVEAARKGFRLLPTNVMVPKASMDEAKAGEAFQNYVTEMRPFSPLGYSLADEPTQAIDPVDFRNRAAALAHQADPGVPVGYCGVWEGPKRNVPRFFQACDLIEAYSPFHLYDVNLWRGIERDLYRSFRRDEQIVTCWTHYSPWGDNEAYSRTAPWLWLFEELNGVSYFSSGQEFAIINPDLTLSHETRWWSEEVAELHRGIGEQIIAMQRDHGGTRILFTPNASGTEQWAFAMNETRHPYRFLSREELSRDGAGENVQLVIAPNLSELSATELDQLEAFVNQGGTLVVTGPAAVVGEAAVRERANAFLGIHREVAPSGNRDDWEKATRLVRNVLIQTDWPIKAQDGDPISGSSLGEQGISPANGASVIAHVAHVGEEGVAADDAQPQFVEELLRTPGALTRKHGKGQVFYLTFTPNRASLKTLLAQWSLAAKLPPGFATLEPDGIRDDALYLYPFEKNGMHLIGVVADYHKLTPSFTIGQKESRLYHQHGALLHQPVNATLRFIKPSHCYDVRTGAYLGIQQEVALTIRPGHPVLYAALPYKITNINIDGPQTAKAGETLGFELALNAEGGTPGGHVVELTLESPDGQISLGDRFLIHTKAGKGTQRLTLPHNAAPGAWKVTTRDATTGVKEERTLTVGPGGPPSSPLPLGNEKTTVSRQPVDWPEGERIAFSEEKAKTKVSLTKPTRNLTRDKKGNDLWRWNGRFVLSNELISYRVNYEATTLPGEDPEKYPQKVKSPYPPGLGFTHPNPASWYSNGYLVISFDGEHMGNYAISEIKELTGEEYGGTVVTWVTPKATIDLRFVLMNDHPGVFQELRIYDVKEPINEIQLGFRSYYWGLGGDDKQQDGFIHPNPSGERDWVVMGNKVNEPGYGKGIGACALRLLPQDFDDFVFEGHGRTRGGRTVNLSVGASARFRWVLWMFPNESNFKVLEAMASDDASGTSRERLLKLFN